MACADCFKGSINEGTPKGSVTKKYGFDTYVAAPPNGAPPKGIVVIIPDAFGWDFSNNRVLADDYAEKGGFLVYLPEFMNGKGADPIVFDYMEKITTPAKGIWDMVGKPYNIACALTHFVPFMMGNGAGVAYPRILAFMRGIRADPEVANLPVGAAGFCWGGKFTFALCHDKDKAEGGKSLIDAGYTAHPSNLKFPADGEQLKKPLSVAVGSNDMVLNAKAIGQMQTALDKTNVEHEVVVYEGAKHGFAVRNNPKDEKANKQGEEAKDQAVAWFAKYFG